MIEDRLVDIETKLAYQEDTVQALNKVVSDQQGQLDRLQKSFEVLIERMQDLRGQLEDTAGPVDEKPPHY